MSAPVPKIQHKGSAFHDITEKATEVIKMKITAYIGQAKIRVSNGVKTRFPLMLVTGVALAALFFTVVVGVPFGTSDASDSSGVVTGANVNGPSNVQQEVDHQMLGYQEVPKSHGAGTVPHRKTISRDKVKEFFGADVVEVLGYDVLVARLSQYGADGQLSSRDMESLDQEIGRLLLAAADRSSEAQAAYNWEIDRLEQRIASLLSNARSNPKTNLVSLSREIDRLDDQVETLRQAAMPQQ